MNEVWVRLAEHFFLDTEPTLEDWQNLSQFLSERNLSQNQVQKILTEEVAPVAGANLGYLIYPVIGVWSGFDKPDLVNKIKKYIEKRSHRFVWINKVQDKYTKRMLKKLNIEKLLRLL